MKLSDWWWDLASPYPPSAPTSPYSPSQTPASTIGHGLATTGAGNVVAFLIVIGLFLVVGLAFVAAGWPLKKRGKR